MKERETLFAEFVAELRKMEKEASQKRKDNVDDKVMSVCSIGGRGLVPNRIRK